MALSRGEIINTAFREWGKSNFTNTSLSSLASSLGVTKAAMYRHFSNKDDLLENMRQTVLEEFYHLIGLFCDKRYDKESRTSLQSVLDAYLSVFFLHYMENPHHFQFFLQFVGKQAELLDDRFHRYSNRIKDVFIPLLIGTDHSTDYREAEVKINYIRTSLIFWLSLVIQQGGKTSSRKAEQLRENLASYILYGVQKNRRFTVAEVPALISACEVNESEMLPPDRIFSAIAENVAEHGLWQTTVEQIAGTLNMSKSSLYFYFKNKKTMIASMLRRENKQLMSIFKGKEKQFTAIEEKTACYALIVASYLLQKPSILTTFNWLRIQGIEIQMKKPDLNKLENDYAFLVNLLDKEALHTHGLRVFELVSLLNMSIVRQVMIDFLSGLPRNDIYNRIYILVNCFHNGIERRVS